MKKIRNFLAFFFTNKIRVAATVAVILAIAFGYWFFAIRGKANQPQYQTAKVEKGTIISTVSASGSIITSNMINITTDASGVVDKVYVKDGDKVFAGQKIAQLTLDSKGAQKAAQAYTSYLSAKNSLTSAQINLYTLQASEFSANQKFINDAVARNLATDDPTYIQENATWLAAEATYKNQANVVSQAQASLNNAWLSYQAVSPIITAPLTGAIDNITISPGMTISGSSSTSTTSTSQQIAVIRSSGNPMASLNLSELDVSKVKPGQKATITLDSLPGKTFTGKVVSVDRIGSVSSGVTNYPTIVTFDVASPEILPNMSTSANIIIATKDNALLVPSSAVITQSGQTVVRILKNGQIETVNVETGLTSDTQTEITSGINEGDEVITSTTTSTTGSSGRSIFSGGFGGGTFRVQGR